MERSIAERLEASLEAVRSLFRGAGASLAYLFGSAAKGVERPDSDLDVAVLLEERIPKEQYGEVRLRLTTELVGLTHTNDVDLVILNAAPPLLADRVVRTGRLILGERREQVRFEVQAIKRCIDTRPLREYAEKRFMEKTPAGSAGNLGESRPVVDRETLIDTLQTLSEYIEELETYRNLPREKVLGDRQVQSAVRYAFQTAIQCVLDAGLHVLVDSELARPRDNKEVLQALGEKGILPADFARAIEGMAGFRNILVHRYFKVDPEIVYGHLRDRLGDLELFLRHLRKYLDRSPPPPP